MENTYRVERSSSPPAEFVLVALFALFRPDAGGGEGSPRSLLTSGAHLGDETTPRSTRGAPGSPDLLQNDII